MSSRYGTEERYRCLNDCRMEGCPGHTLQVQFFNTADVVRILVDGEITTTFDGEEFEAMLRSVNRMPE